jgi:hypothetical protein
MNTSAHLWKVTGWTGLLYYTTTIYAVDAKQARELAKRHLKMWWVVRVEL